MEDGYFKAIIIATVAILVGLAFWSTLGDSIGTLAKTQTSTNVSFTMPANNSVKDLIPCGQLNITDVVIYNPEGNVLLIYGANPTGNYTIAQAAGSDGYLASRITATNLNSTWASAAMNISCSYQPRGYVTDSAGRGIALLIPIFAALLIMIAAMPQVRDWMSGLMGRN